jgi:hypothetical protein
MAGRTALTIAVAALPLFLASCGSKSWSCTWECSSNMTSGTHTYPDGPDPTSQCALDFGSTCTSFTCTCDQ